MLDALRLSRRWVVLGDPGAGKTTFVREVLARCAAGQPPDGLPDLEAGWPLLVQLRDVAARLRLPAFDLHPLPGERHPETLCNALWAQVAEDLQNGGLAAFTESLRRAFDLGRVWVVLDGLDETPPEQRAVMGQLVQALVQRDPAPPLVLVTCRVRSYTGETQLAAFDTLTLAPLNEPQIKAFAHAWYQAQLGPTEAPQAARRGQALAQAALAERHLRELAENPMLLTVMAIIHTTDTQLPDQSVKLYRRAVEILLTDWQKHKFGLAQLDEFVHDTKRLLKAMEQLAYKAHSLAQGAAPTAPTEGAADLSRTEALALFGFIKDTCKNRW